MRRAGPTRATQRVRERACHAFGRRLGTLQKSVLVMAPGSRAWEPRVRTMHPQCIPMPKARWTASFGNSYGPHTSPLTKADDPPGLMHPKHSPHTWPPPPYPSAAISHPPQQHQHHLIKMYKCGGKFMRCVFPAACKALMYWQQETKGVPHLPGGTKRQYWWHAGGICCQFGCWRVNFRKFPDIHRLIFLKIFPTSVG